MQEIELVQLEQPQIQNREMWKAKLFLTSFYPENLKERKIIQKLSIQQPSTNWKVSVESIESLMEEIKLVALYKIGFKDRKVQESMIFCNFCSLKTPTQKNPSP